MLSYLKVMPCDKLEPFILCRDIPDNAFTEVHENKMPRKTDS